MYHKRRRIKQVGRLRQTPIECHHKISTVEKAWNFGIPIPIFSNAFLEAYILKSYVHISQENEVSFAERCPC